MLFEPSQLPHLWTFWRIEFLNLINNNTSRLNTWHKTCHNFFYRFDNHDAFLFILVLLAEYKKFRYCGNPTRVFFSRQGALCPQIVVHDLYFFGPMKFSPPISNGVGYVYEYIISVVCCNSVILVLSVSYKFFIFSKMLKSKTMK